MRMLARTPTHRFSLIALAIVLTALAPRSAVADDSAAGIEYFEKHIRPVLVQQCYECHALQAKTLRGGLRLDTRAASRRGGDSGPAVVPGKVDESLLISALKYDSFEMPPSGRLPAETVRHFERWIEMGAPDPRESEPAAAKPPVEMNWDEARKFWAFQAPQARPAPRGEWDGWLRRPIDAFVARKRSQQGLPAAREADRRVLVRRVTFDLTGLPPTPDEVDAFVDDRQPRAYERLVERLLASPHYGERWTRLWLDLARYAEDQAHIVGNNKSLFYPNAYLYRDWVIEAFNRDLPYDEFIRRQLAIDLMDPDSTDDLAALGFMGLGPKYYRRNDLSVMADEWEDRVDTVSRGLLGITVACARCHDHKYDPITVEDYHALAGVFASTEMFNRPMPVPAAESAGSSDDQAENKAGGSSADKQPDQKQPDQKKPAKNPPADKKPGKKQPEKKQPEKKKPADKDAAPKQMLHIVRDGKVQDLSIFIRGDVRNKGPQVARRFLRVLSSTEPQPFQQGSGRRELAEAIASKDNSLTARVFVNRIWAEYFGRGLVGTPSNFGELGERPSHPELLDDLAVRFMRSGWSIKWLQREIVLSATYRQSSLAASEVLEADPSNRYLARMARRRLPIEAWRDAMLSVSGQLDDTVGGPSIDVSDPQQGRRTIYSIVSRFHLNPMLSTFDFPDPNVHAERRVETTTPLQKLFALNSPFSVRMADELAGRLLADDADVDSKMDRAYQLLYARGPSESERAAGREFLESFEDGAEAWRQYAQVLLASNEFLFVD